MGVYYHFLIQLQYTLTRCFHSPARWGVHDCRAEEAVGIVCKAAVDVCPDGHWKCDNSPECIPTHFICDEVVDCSDGSDEGPQHCEVSEEETIRENINDFIITFSYF